MRSVKAWIALGAAEQFAISALRPAAISLGIVALCTGSFAAQKSAGPPAGTLIVDGGGATEPIVRRFVEIAGGRRADIVVFATGPSEIRFGDQNVILNPDWPRDRPAHLGATRRADTRGRERTSGARVRRLPVDESGA